MPGLFARKLEGALPQSLAEREAAQNRIGRLKTVSEFLSDLVDAVKDTDLPAAVAQISPWAEALGSTVAETVGPVKFVVKLFENLGRVDDAPTLGYMACCLAYQRAVEKALPQIPELRQVSKIEVRKDVELPESAEAYDFSGFSLPNALRHDFVQDADRSLKQVLVEGLALDATVAGRLILEVRTRFVSELIEILTDRGNSEKFEPFFRLVQLRAQAPDSYASLRRHVEYQRWLFEERPVLDVEPFALQHVYVDLDCGDLAWGEIDRERTLRGEGGPVDPFDEKNGGRSGVLETVLRYVADSGYEEPIVIQGPAGAGKSSFTLRLCCALANLGLRPIRIELKNLSTRDTKDPWQALQEAVELGQRERGSMGLFLDARIFEERLPFSFVGREAEICPYVLILDGWDEISSSASLGYQQELNRLLQAVRDELFRRSDGKVRVVLSGRPTGVIGQSALVHSATRVLTLRDMSPVQLNNLVERFRLATRERPLCSEGVESWNLNKAGKALKAMLLRYAQENSARLEVLGLPLLAHLTLRLVAENPQAAQRLVNDTTALYRSLIDLVSCKAGKPHQGRRREKDEPVITGADLRCLLQDTAAAMTALGVRNISREELKIRLGRSFEQLDREVRALGEEQVLGRLLISFFFKGGHPELGCEFSHKSFREYLFAEKVVERLKIYGHRSETDLPLRVGDSQPYWQDFASDDLRFKLSRDLLEHLGPQWLQVEEWGHIQGLLAWEIGRARSKSQSDSAFGQPSEVLDEAGWCRVRDGLADLWDWWGEGIHMRPLPKPVQWTTTFDYEPPIAAEYAKGTIWRSRPDKAQTPVRLTTLDGHLGEALFGLCAIVHGELMKSSSVSGGEVHGRPRPYQVVLENGDIGFDPSGGDSMVFHNYSARINACGFRAESDFPSGVVARKMFLSRGFLYMADFADSDLVGSCLSDSYLVRADLSRVDFSGADLSSAVLCGADLSLACLVAANLTGADLSRAELFRAILCDADLTDSDISRGDLSEANLTGAILIGANLTGAKLAGATLVRADLSEADLTHADLTGADLSDANLNHALISGTILNAAKLARAEIAIEDLSRVRGVPSILPDGGKLYSREQFEVWLLERFKGDHSSESQGAAAPEAAET